MTWLLLPGLRLVRRDAGHLQLGVDPPLVAVLPDLPGIRRLIHELAVGAPLELLDDIRSRALEVLVRAGLVVAQDTEATRAAHRARCVVHLDVPDDVLPQALRLVSDAGLGLTRTAAASVALVWSAGETDRDRLDGWMRSGTPHLVVAEPTEGARVGPYVVPGVTACLRCLDARAGEADPHRAVVVAQAARAAPLRPGPPDAPARALALAWSVRDLVTAAEGGRPVTWSATASLGVLPPELTTHRRHPHCGCAWDVALASAG